MKTAIFTDSTAIIDPQVKRKLNIKTIPLPLLMNGKVYYEKYNHDRVKLHQKLLAEDGFLTPGQVSDDALHEIMDDLVTKGYTDVICVHLDNSISGLGDNLHSFNIKNSQLRLHLVDSYSFGIAEGSLAVLVGEWIEQGEHWKSIKNKILQARDAMQTLIVMKNLKHITTMGYVKNGLSPVEKAFFKAKTLMKFGDKGKLKVLNTYSQYSRLFRDIRWQIAPAYQEITGQLKISITAIRNRKNDQTIAKLVKILQRVFPVAKINLYEMPLSIIAYTGMNSIVVSWN